MFGLVLCTYLFSIDRSIDRCPYFVQSRLVSCRRCVCLLRTGVVTLSLLTSMAHTTICGVFFAKKKHRKYTRGGTSTRTESVRIGKKRAPRAFRPSCVLLLLLRSSFLFFSSSCEHTYDMTCMYVCMCRSGPFFGFVLVCFCCVRAVCTFFFNFISMKDSLPQAPPKAEYGTVPR